MDKKEKQIDIKKGASSADVHRYVFVEYGPMELDINLRVRVHELEKALEEKVRLCNHGA